MTEIRNYKQFKRKLKERLAKRTDPATTMREIPGESKDVREARTIVRVLMASCPFDTGAAQWIEREKISVRQEQLVKAGMEFWDAFEIARAEWLLAAQGVKVKPYVPKPRKKAPKRAERKRHEAERAPVKKKVKPKLRRVQIESNE